MAEKIVSAIEIDTSGAARGADLFEASAKRIVAANDQVGRGAERLTAIIGDQSRKYDALVRRIDPAAASLAKYQKELALLNRQFSTGRIGPEEQAQRLKQLEQAYGGVTTAEQARMRQLDALRAKSDPMFAAQQRYEDALRDLNEAQALGAVSGERYQAALDRIERELSPAAAAAREAANANQRLADRVRDLTESVDPAVRAQRIYNEQVREADELLSKGAISQDVHTAAIAKAGKELDRAKAAAERAAGGTKLTAHEMQNLGFQLNDVVAQLASGSNPLMILGQQGPQITQVFGGLRATLARIPVGLGVAVGGFGLLAGAVGLAGSRFLEISSQAKRFEAIGRTLNPQLRGMADELRRITLATSERGTSLANAAEITRKLADVSKLRVELYQDIAGIAVDIGAVLGEEPQKVAQDLAEAFSTGANGVAKLNERLRFLHGDQLKTIEDMDRSGDRFGAMRLALSLLVRSFEGDAPKLKTAFARATEAMGDAWDRLVEKFANSSPMIGFFEQSSREFDFFARLFAKLGTGAGASAEKVATLTEKIEAQRARIDEARQAAERIAKGASDFATEQGVGLSGDPAGEAIAKVQRLEDELAKLLELRRELGRANAGKGYVRPVDVNDEGLTEEEAERVRRSREAYARETEAMSKSIVERQIAMAKLQAREAVFARGGTEAEARAEGALAERKARDELTRAIQDENNALDAEIKGQLAVASAYARSTEEGLRAEAMQQALAEATQTGVDAAERANRILAKGAGAAYLAGRQQLNQLKRTVANQQPVVFGAGLSASAQQDAQRGIEADEAYADKIAAAAAARNDKLVAGLRQQRDEYEKTLRLRDQNAAKIATAEQFRSLRDEVELTEREGQLIGATNEKREQEIGLLQLRQTLIERGYSGKELDDEYDKISKLIIKRAQLAEATRKNTEEYERNKQAILDSVDIMRDGFEDLVLNGTKFADVLRNISQAFLRLGTDMLVIEPLKRFLSESMDTNRSSGGGSNFWSVISGLGSSIMGLWSGVPTGGPGVTGTTTATSGGFGGAPVLPVERVPLAHTGWHVGHEPPPAARTVPTSIFVQAPRFHSGGILPGERAVIVQDGEEILTSRDPRHRRNYRGGAAGNTIIMNISTPNADSFRASQGQISATAGRAMALAARRNG